MLGDGEVGKTSILNMYVYYYLICLRYAERKFTPKHLTTLGLDQVNTQLIVSDGLKIPVVLWDTAGQERFRTITYGFYKNANGVILVYDISNRKSFQNIKTWLAAINEHASDSITKVLVGNKTDLDIE